jgi:hypothetical protein
MNINFRDDVIAVVWVSERGIEFDLNPKTFPLMLREGAHVALGKAMEDFGKAIREGRIEKTGAPQIYGPDGRRAN